MKGKAKSRDLTRRRLRRQRKASDALRDTMRDCRRLYGEGKAK
jgi:hypothetical protein